LVGDDLSKNTIFKKYWEKTEPMIQKNSCYLDKLKIIPVIKVRKNSSIKNNINCTPRKLLLLLSVLEQFNDIIDGRKNINLLHN
jgi:hypothetical protein